MKSPEKSKTPNEVEMREEFYIEEYIKAASQSCCIKEHPIKSIKKFAKGESPADAIITTKIGPGVYCDDWIETTTVSRNQEMWTRMGNQRKYPEKFKGQTTCMLLVPIDNPNSLPNKVFEAIRRKMKKDYGPMIRLLGKKGILLVCFENEDPFFDRNEWGELISFLDFPKNQRLWLSDFGVKSLFKEIVFGAYVVGEGWRFKTILSEERLKNLNDWQFRRQELLKSYMYVNEIDCISPPLNISL